MIRVTFDRKRWRSPALQEQPAPATPDSPLPDPAKPAVPQTELPDILPAQPAQEVAAPVTGTPAQPGQPSYLDRYVEGNKRPDPSDYHAGADWLATLTPPLSNEEVERRARRARAVEGIGHLGNMISAFANVIYTGKGATPMAIPTVPSGKVDAWEDRMRALQDNYATARQRAAAQDNAGYLAALKTWQAGYNDAAERDLDVAETARKKAADDAVAQYRQDKLALDKERETERKRHNTAQERTARQRVAASGGGSGRNTAGNGSEVAYVTKYGDVVFDNPKNKRAATLSTLEVMRNGAPERERERIDALLYNAQNGDIDSYNKAEMYVSQNLNGNAEALRHLYELAHKYGRINRDQRQEDAIRRATTRNNSLGWGRNNNSSSNETDW